MSSSSSSSSLSAILATELKGKTVRVLTKNGFSLQGRVVEYDKDHMNVVLDCIDSTLAVFSSTNNNKSSSSSSSSSYQAEPPHIGPWHKEMFIRGSNIRWLEVEGHQNLGI